MKILNFKNDRTYKRGCSSNNEVIPEIDFLKKEENLEVHMHWICM